MTIDFQASTEFVSGTETLESALGEPYGELVDALTACLGIPARKFQTEVLPSFSKRVGSTVVPPEGNNPSVGNALHTGNKGDLIIAGHAEASFAVRFERLYGRALYEVTTDPVWAEIPDGRRPAVSVQPLGWIRVKYALETPYPIAFAALSMKHRSRVAKLTAKKHRSIMDRVLLGFLTFGTSPEKIFVFNGLPFETGHPEMDRFVLCTSKYPSETTARLQQNELLSDTLDILLRNVPFMTAIDLNYGEVSWRTDITDCTTVDTILTVLTFLPRLQRTLYGLNLG